MTEEVRQPGTARVQTSRNWQPWHKSRDGPEAALARSQAPWCRTFAMSSGRPGEFSSDLHRESLAHVCPFRLHSRAPCYNDRTLIGRQGGLANLGAIHDRLTALVT